MMQISLCTVVQQLLWLPVWFSWFPLQCVIPWLEKPFLIFWYCWSCTAWHPTCAEQTWKPSWTSLETSSLPLSFITTVNTASSTVELRSLKSAQTATKHQRKLQQHTFWSFPLHHNYRHCLQVFSSFIV